ncbi:MULTISPECIES: crotonase/enoyl-CoA hydratase family protein [Rhizobium]|uniref:Methylglutaconyl-CoA hydratase n=1 Tax=Rhizobium favelukesii TaxID=348824 RepID=W6RZT4_9HYPH|nr:MULTISPECIES: crotonase/enoyl-CoA hydratase family protein [Rhizobium]MCA0803796.1 crotonase/enoyl-CoA hydratase family protein [Rhizobium sp. T1473]MCS0457133.1 crotonase/enoyl-CoA hydratase family protein [Rhizobium favelukesii]UFS82644.1 crotonase/enoyl-CoA hydratase family protein [Rhizobium sp. T136]CDM59781.1 methylglutaconyl-CoA hydratase [Rhizobium favelukesii]
MPETLMISIDERGVARLTLARKDKHNAMSAEMIDELTEAASALGSDKRVRAIVLAGAGKSFCAGGDLEWMRAQFQASRAERIAEARRLAMMFKALNELPRPLIGCVHGSAFGGGIGLISVCDTVIASEAARFGLTEVRLGLIPATISPYVVARIGSSAARSLFVSGRMFNAAHAKSIGLVASIVAPADLDRAVDREVDEFIAASPQAAARAKALVRSLASPITDEIVESVISQLADSWETDEAQAGISAFFERQRSNS